MITDLFLLQLLLTFLVASGWIYLTVLAATRCGTRIAGFIGGLPSTVILSFFFIGFTQSAEMASRATTVFPLAIGVSGFFLVVYAWLVRRGFLLALSAAVVTWFALSLLVALLHPARFVLNLAIYALAVVVAYRVLEDRLLVRSVTDSGAGPVRSHPGARSVFGGAVIMLTVLAARLGGPVVGGLLAAFPAMFIATLAITHALHGAEFSRAMTKPLMVTGTITVAVYSIATRYLYVSAGLYSGTLVAIGIAAVSAFLTYRYVLPRLL